MELIGKKLTEVKLAKDKKAMLFSYEGGELLARVEGDCCSSTWIEHVELPSSLPAMVLEAERIPMPDLGQGEDEYDVIAYYGYRIRTDMGDLIIDYRNSSNGYYGGDIVFGEGEGVYFYGGVYGQNESAREWETVKS